MFLLDTDVLVDCLRGTVPAREWLRAASQDDFIVPGVAAMELLVGCRNRSEMEQVQKFLSAFRVAWPEASEFARAFEVLAGYRLQTGLSIPDCLIAAMALSRGLRLCTFKHFAMIGGLIVDQPYARL